MKNYLALIFATFTFCNAIVWAGVDSPRTSSEISANKEEAAPWWTASLSAEFDSKYIFRGVNSLPHSGIGIAELYVSVYDFSVDLWQANGIDTAYHELYTTLTWAHAFGPVTLSGGYINDYFPDDDALDLGFDYTQEFFLGIAWKPISGLTASLTYNRDFDKIRGGYLEGKVAGSIPVVKNVVAIEPYASVSYDLGYNSYTRAFNNAQFGVNVPVTLSKHLTVSAFGAVSVPLEAIRDIETTHAWAGFRATFNF